MNENQIVYILWEDDNIRGIFTTEKKAQEWKQILCNKNINFFCQDDFEIVPAELDKEL